MEVKEEALARAVHLELARLTLSNGDNEMSFFTKNTIYKLLIKIN